MAGARKSARPTAIAPRFITDPVRLRGRGGDRSRRRSRRCGPVDRRRTSEQEGADTFVPHTSLVGRRNATRWRAIVAEPLEEHIPHVGRMLAPRDKRQAHPRPRRGTRGWVHRVRRGRDECRSRRPGQHRVLLVPRPLRRRSPRAARRVQDRPPALSLDRTRHDRSARRCVSDDVDGRCARPRCRSHRARRRPGQPPRHRGGVTPRTATPRVAGRAESRSGARGPPGAGRLTPRTRWQRILGHQRV